MQIIPKTGAGHLHFYQFDGSHRNRNECALCAMAMVLHIAASASGLANFDLEPATLGRFLDRLPFRHPRFPAWFPRVGGATHPWAARGGLRAYIGHLKEKGVAFAWRPVLYTRQSKADLAAALEARRPSMIYGVGITGIPHVVVPVGRTEDGWLLLDPGYPSERQPMLWSDEQLDAWWANYAIIYPRGTMLSLEPA
jgi:hypothetical protein